jgi:adiponectin receptor
MIQRPYYFREDREGINDEEENINPFWKRGSSQCNTEDINRGSFRTTIHRIFYSINPFIRSGFRVMPVRSYRNCAKSVFCLHNETMNIWTHIVPSIIWFIMSILVWVRPGWIFIGPGSSSYDRIIYTIHCIMSMICMLLSAMYHTFSCNSVTDYHYFLSGDYCGIINMLSSGVVTVSYFELYCYDEFRVFFLCVILFVWIYYHSNILKYAYTGYDPGLLYSFFYYTLPIVWVIKVWIIEYGRFELYKYKSIWLIIFTFFAMFFCYVVRMLKLPERIFPRTFDIFGASHQLWHLCIAILSFITFFSTIVMNNRGTYKYCLIK